MFVTNCISTTKIQKISEITNFFRHYFLSRTEVPNKKYRRNDIKKRQSFAHFANDSSPVFRIESYHVLAKYFKAFALTGRQVCDRNYPGRCPGLGASALSGRVGLTCEIRNLHLRFQQFYLLCRRKEKKQNAG